jgi:hypothetical protein
MYCPSCAQENALSQRFCRACGLNLEQVTGMLVEQNRLDAKDLATTEKYLNRFGMVAFGGLGVVVLFGAGYFFAQMFVKMVLNGSTSHVILGILGMLGIICALAALGFVIANELLKEKRKKSAFVLDDPELASGLDTGKLLAEPEMQPVASVTEHSTELLNDNVRTRRLD